MRPVVGEPKHHSGDVDGVALVVLGVAAHVNLHLGFAGHGGDVVAHVMLQQTSHDRELPVALLHGRQASSRKGQKKAGPRPCFFVLCTICA